MTTTTSDCKPFCPLCGRTCESECALRINDECALMVLTRQTMSIANDMYTLNDRLSAIAECIYKFGT